MENYHELVEGVRSAFDTGTYHMGRRNTILGSVLACFYRG